MEKESEKAIERYLKQEMTKIGGLCYKFTSPNRKGVPDRIAIFPPLVQGSPGPVWWIEVKSTGQKLTPLQEVELRNIARVGQLVMVLDRKEGVDMLIKKYQEIKDGILREAQRHPADQIPQEERRIIIPGRK